MKKIFLLILLCVFPAKIQNVFAGGSSVTATLVIPLDTEGVEIALYEKQGQLLIYKPKTSDFRQEFEYLVYQTEKFSFFAGQRTKLSNGYELIFDGGRLFLVCFQGDQNAYVIFSSNIKVDGKTIHFRGEDESSALFDEH